MQPTSVRILVVDDFDPWRRHVSLLLLEKSELQVVGEASDGLEAVQRAVELKPDLILLDIGLPMLSGIEAARRISRLVPESKIIFLTLESSADVVEEALSFGACGYVVKSMAKSELLAAIEAVGMGKKFVSDGVDR
jgi:DNA-binding NarL/FixJ family response regulator